MNEANYNFREVAVSYQQVGGEIIISDKSLLLTVYQRTSTDVNKD